MRGALDWFKSAWDSVGIIPADAGSTDAPKHHTELEKDHPRGCGEHLVKVRDAQLEEGSSPRMRGARQAGEHPGGRWWIIPADAGSTGRCPRTCRATADHPRGCGEHWPSESSEVLSRGSSPRMRGARDAWCLPYSHRRIIPADAGSTRSGPVSCDKGLDHPRGCGEHIYRQADDSIRCGSSPRMRGARSVPQPGFRG